MIIKPVSRLVQELDAKSITVIGNPCADGLGIDSLRLFHAGLTGAEGDLIIIPGDISPFADTRFYREAALFVDRTAPLPVHVMRGNHDSDDFEKYFGHSNRALLSESFVVIMLDNSKRRFSPETLEFLRQTLAIVNSPNIIVAFHFPPPNRVSGNSLDAAAWKEFEDAAGVWRNRISLLLCGHDHSYYEDDIDGLHLVVTGCGGSMVGRLDRVMPPGHHAVEIIVGPDGLKVERRNISGTQVNRSPEILGILGSIYRRAAEYHVDMVLSAEEADRCGMPGLGRLHRAVAASFLGQARVFRRLLASGDEADCSRAALAEHVSMTEYSQQEMLAIMEQANDEVASYALKAAARTEIVGKALLADADRQLESNENGDLSPTHYWLCGSCSLIYAADHLPDLCPECGAPPRLLKEIE